MIAIQEGDRLQRDLYRVFQAKYALDSMNFGGISSTLLRMIDGGSINFLLTHPITSEEELVVTARKKIPVVIVRGRSDFEGAADQAMFNRFIKAGLPVLDKTVYFNSYGYLIETFAAKVIEELAKQL